MAYAQWIEVELVPADYTILIRNAQTSYGKFYQRGDKDDELSSSDIDNITLPVGSSAGDTRQSVFICSCGREDSPSGTEGSFEIWDSQTKVGTFQWDDPWGFGSNTFSFQPASNGYSTTISGGNSGSSGPIGAVTLTTQVVPVIVLLNYQAGVITLNWMMSGLTLTTPLQVAITNLNTKQTTTYPATGFSTQIQQGLDADVAYQATVTPVGGATSAAVPIISAPPQWQLISYDTGQLTLTWQAVADPNVTGYLVMVSGLNSAGYPVANATTTTVAATLTALQPYPATVSATNGIVSGPQSPALVPLTAPPTSPSLVFDGSELLLSWSPSDETNVTGYTANLLANGALRASVSPAKSPQPFDSGLDLGVVFSGQARATGTMTQGPWSAAAAGPYQTQLNYNFDSDGRLHTIQWSGGATETYVFDAAGNLLSTAVTAPGLAAAATPVLPAGDAASATVMPVSESPR